MAVVPWLELLDLSKWKALASPSSTEDEEDNDDDDLVQSKSSGEDIASDEEAESVSSEGNKEAFSLIFYGRRRRFDTISISTEAIRNAKSLSVYSGLANLDPANVVQALVRSAEEHDYLLDEVNFNRFMQRVLPSRRDRQGLSSELFSNFFIAFDRTKRGYVDAFEVACGITILCSG